MAYIGRSVDIGMFEKQVLTPDSSTTTFTLTYAVGSANSLLVVYGGVVQEPQVAYSVSGGGQSIAFSEAPATGTTTYIIYLGKQLTTPRAAGQETTKQTFAGNGSTVTFTLTDPPVVPAGIMVFVDGILQREGSGNNYVSSGSTITFSSAPDTSAEIDVYTLVKEKVSIDTVADGSITVTKLAAGHPTWNGAGETVIASASTGNSLRITNTGSGNSLLVEDSASTDSTPFVVDATGNVGIGTASPTTKLTISANATLPSAGAPSGTNLWVVGAGAANHYLLMDNFASSPQFSGRRAQGTSGSPTAVGSGNNLAIFSGFGYGATGYSSSARAEIRLPASETWTDSAQGTYISFHTTTLGTTSLLERMRIDSDGNVGIGTTAPVSKLQVLGTTNSGYATSNVITSGGTAISNSGSLASGSSLRLTANFGGAVNFTGRASELVFGADNGNFGGGGGFPQANLGAITAISENGNAVALASSMLFYTSAGNNINERMRIDSSGNVGIGTSSPTAKLDVATSINLGLNYLNVAYDIGSGAGWLNGYNATYSSGVKHVNLGAVSAMAHLTGNVVFYTNTSAVAGTAVNERMRIDTSGNVGIGTSAPNTKLQVYKAAASAFTGTSAGALIVTDSTNTLNYFTSIDFNTTNAPSVPYARIGMSYTGGGSTLNFGTSNNYASGITNTAMTIDPTGNVGIGIVPSYPLHIHAATGQVYLNSSTGTNLVRYSTNNTGGGFQFGIDNSAGSNFFGATPYGRAIFSDSAYPIGIFTNGTLRLTIPADAGGIKFPATQVASADANTLDDYEEGNWTPVLTTSGGTTPTGVAYDATYTKGRYTKIGRVVHIRATIVLTSKGTGGAGDLIISGAPFSPANYSGYAYSPITAFYYASGGITGTITPCLYDQGTNIYLSSGSNANTIIQWSVISGTEKISINGTYMAD